MTQKNRTSFNFNHICKTNSMSHGLGLVKANVQGPYQMSASCTRKELAFSLTEFT